MSHLEYLSDLLSGFFPHLPIHIPLILGPNRWFAGSNLLFRRPDKLLQTTCQISLRVRATDTFSVSSIATTEICVRRDSVALATRVTYVFPCSKNGCKKNLITRD